MRVFGGLEMHSYDLVDKALAFFLVLMGIASLAIVVFAIVQELK